MTTNIILYAGVGGSSVREVVQVMLEEVQVVRSRNGRLTPSVGEANILIRFGCNTRLPAKVVFNTGKAIRLASNKAGTRRVLHEKGVPVPTPGSSVLPCIARPLKHRGGKGLWFCQTQAEVELVARRHGPVYFSAFYPKKREYRVHVAHGKVLILNEKVPRDGQEVNRNMIVWNHALNDFYFQVVRWGQWPLNVVKLAIQAVEVIGLHFGAVDILAEPADDDLPPAVVCEINTGMSIDSAYTAARYGRYFDWLLRRGELGVPYSINSSNPVDYAWQFKSRKGDETNY